MKHFIKENRSFLIFLCCFALFRSPVADWTPIPSGSMRPSLLEGDVVLVNRLAYDLKLPLTDIVLAHLNEPQRGDVVTFSSPTDGTRLIKRLIALPGDTVEMRNEKLLINGKEAEYDHAQKLEEPLGNGENIPALRLTENFANYSHRMQILQGMQQHSNFGPITVPEGQYLMLGDNRDNSADSRYFGFVPRKLIIGHAHHILVSADILTNWMPRWDRFGQKL
jgi:signal peptidase I